MCIISTGDVEVRQGKEEEVEVVVTTVDVSTSQPSPPSVPESSRDSECNGPWPGYPDCGEKIQVTNNVHNGYANNNKLIITYR